MGFFTALFTAALCFVSVPVRADSSNHVRPRAQPLPTSRGRVNNLLRESDIPTDGSMTLRFLDRIAYSSPARGAVALGEKILKDNMAPRNDGNVIAADGKIYRVKFQGRGAVVATTEKTKISVKDILTPLQAAANLTHKTDELKFEAALSVEVTSDEPYHQIRIPTEDGRNLPAIIRDYLTTQLPRHHRAIAKDYEAYTERVTSERLFSIPVPSHLKQPNLTPQTAGFTFPLR